MDEWIKDVEDLAQIAQREPQLAYSAYVYGLSKRWNYVCRTTPDVSALMRRLDFTVKEVFVPAILDRIFSCTEEIHSIFALPCRLGGLSIHKLSETSDLEFEFSQMVTKDLTDAIYNQDREYTSDHVKISSVKLEVTKRRADYFQNKRTQLVETLSPSHRLQLDLASEKGASSWLTALPLQTFGYSLNKQQFTDALALRYDYNIKNSARLCSCGEPNTVNHLLVCKRGGYVSLRHNSLRDVMAEMLRNADCKDVTTEPALLPVNGVQLPKSTNTAADARLDVSARSLWNPLERAFLDIRVFHPLAPSNVAHGSIANMYRSHENEKKTSYNARVLEIERGTFTPVVFSTTGGMGIEASKLMKRIAERTERKTGQRYADIMSFIGKRIRFDLLKTTTIALRGERGRRVGQAKDIADLDLNIQRDI